jgi:virginiamycin B lyase
MSPGGSLSRPYAIAIANGFVWYTESGVQPNTIVRFDPTTKRFVVQAVPGGGGTIRNMAAARDGRVYVAESDVNRVGIITPNE